MHLAQLNVGRLVADTEDPRVAEFMAALDRINGLGKRMPGFVWMMEGSGEPGTGNTEAKIDGDPRAISNLTVWESAEALEAVRLEHRAPDSSTSGGGSGSRCWGNGTWSSGGCRRGTGRRWRRRWSGWRTCRAHGESEHAFGWAYMKEARLCGGSRNCSAMAAE